MLFGAATGKTSGDRGRRLPPPRRRLFVYTEVEKKKLKRERAASKKPALREGFAAQGWLFGVFGRSFG